MATLLPLAILFSALLLLANAQRNCPGGYFKKSDNTCEKCPAGTFQVRTNECTPCPAGSYGLSPGRTSSRVCISCTPGTFSATEGATSSTVCKPCPHGTDSKSGFSRCITCGAGEEVRRKFGFTETCIACSANYFNDQPSSRDCKPCPQGTQSRTGADKCQPCEKGTFRYFHERCTGCAPGTFADEKGSSACKLCPPGTFSRDGAASCTPCAAGMFQNEIARSRCKQCPPGTSSLGTNPAGCKDPLRGCPFGTFENNDGECEACLPGQKFDPSRNKCVSCAEDEVSNGGATQRCTKCPPDREPARGFGNRDGVTCACKVGSAAPGGLSNLPCTSCPPGKIDFPPEDYLRTGALRSFGDFDRTCRSCASGNPGDDQRGCTTCPFDSVLDSERGTCAKCPAGTVVRPMAREQGPLVGCLSIETGCPVGTIVRNGKCLNGACPRDYFLSRRRVCTRCRAGRFRGPRKCKPCRPRERSAGGAVEQCSRCPQGQTGVGNECVCDAGLTRVNGECVPCPSGTVSVANSTCVLCPPGTIVSGTERRGCGRCPNNHLVQGDGAVRKCVKCPQGSKLSSPPSPIRTYTCTLLDPYNKDPELLDFLSKLHSN